MIRPSGTSPQAKTHQSTCHVREQSVFGPVRVRDRIDLPDRSILFPVWKLSISDFQEIYGGWIDASFAVVTVHQRRMQVHRAGGFFPPGSVIEPLDIESRECRIRASSFICPEMTVKLEFGTSWHEQAQRAGRALVRHDVENEYPIAMPIRGSLKDTSWFISTYLDDDVTPIRHADMSAKKVRANLGELTYCRCSTPGFRRGATSYIIRDEHSDESWNYLSTLASSHQVVAAEKPLPDLNKAAG